MNRWTTLGLLAVAAAALLGARTAVADPPTNATLDQKLDALRDDVAKAQMRLATLNEQILMLDGRLKELSGLGDKLSLTDERAKNKFLELELLLNKSIAEQKEALQKQQQALDELKRSVTAAGNGGTRPPGPSSTDTFKPGDGSDLDRRLQRMEQALEQMGAAMTDIRRATPLPLPPQSNEPLPTVANKPARRVLVRNRAPFPVTVYLDGMPFVVEPDKTGQYLANPESDSVTYEVPSSNIPRKTLAFDQGRTTRELTISWP